MSIKRFLVLALAAVLALSLTACGGSGDSQTSAAGGASTAEGSEAAGGQEAQETGPAIQGLTAPLADSPALLSSVGQSADVEMVKTMLDRGGVDFTQNNLATADDLAGHSTLVLAVGGSSKGLGAAGIDADQELARVNDLMAAAQSDGMTIIVLHVGGDARRGELSDKFITPTFEVADYAIVVADGDKDYLMAGIASSRGIPMDVVASMTDAIEPLAAAFK